MDKQWKKKLYEYSFTIITGVIILAMVLFCICKPDNLMHSDTTAEVILSKLLAEENKLITTNWFYSTEIRIVYSHLLMVPLFKIFSSYRLVKFLSVFIFYILMLLAYLYVSKRFQINKKYAFIGLALFFSPLSNEYLDMMFIGCFYSSQAICTYVVLGIVATWFMSKEQSNREKKTKKFSFLVSLIGTHLFAFILGLSGLRYLASLYLPMLLAVMWILFSEEGELFDANPIKKPWFVNFIYTVSSLVCAGLGFLVNKFYLATHYSFDTTSEVVFVPLSEVADRFLESLKLMVEFFGYYQVEVVSGRGIVNVLKMALFVFFVGAIVYLFRHRKEKLNRLQRFLLYYFVLVLLINWYMLVFTGVLMQYRYWIPVYIIAVLLVALFFQVFTPEIRWQKQLYGICVGIAALSSLYGELWQDAKYNDCEKRYAYMEFLESQGYTFGYATFWNASVTEYLSNGKMEVGNLGGKDGVSAPYEWLCKKDLYKEGYHKGKTFLLLARTEEAGMLKGDFTVMPDGEKVYEDEYYAVYEGTGMYLFSEESEIE